jgi:serine/threonine protein kinase
MPRYGKNLENIFETFKNNFSSSTIFKIGILLLEIIERIHSAGYTYNDLKLDNILFGDS